MGDGLAFTGGGGGVRPSPTAMPNVAPKIRASTVASRISGRRFSGSACSAATAVRRCRQPNTASAVSAMILARISAPYSVVNRSETRILMKALMTPEHAIATKHHSATAEKRRAARSAYSPPRIAWASRASSPPAHNAPATRWISRLLAPRSCDPPADECPVSPNGINVISDPASRNGVHPHRSTAELARVTINARNAVHRQALAVSTRLVTAHSCTGLRWSLSGCPDTSEMVSGTSSAAHTVHTPDATVPRRSAR